MGIDNPPSNARSSRADAAECRIAMVNERTTRLTEKAVSEAKTFAVIATYLWVLFTLFQLVRLAILRKENPANTFGYRVGFSLINALIFGKIILLAEAFHVGEHFKDTLLVYAILFKSAVF